jgi:hypothetical protein
MIITAHIIREFLDPEFCIARRSCGEAATCVTVPEATMHEDGSSVLG